MSHWLITSSKKILTPKLLTTDSLPQKNLSYCKIHYAVKNEGFINGNHVKHNPKQHFQTKMSSKIILKVTLEGSNQTFWFIKLSLNNLMTSNSLCLFLLWLYLAKGFILSCVTERCTFNENLFSTITEMSFHWGIFFPMIGNFDYSSNRFLSVIQK